MYHGTDEKKMSIKKFIRKSRGWKEERKKEAISLKKLRRTFIMIRLVEERAPGRREGTASRGVSKRRSNVAKDER